MYLENDADLGCAEVNVVDANIISLDQKSVFGMVKCWIEKCVFICLATSSGLNQLFLYVYDICGLNIVESLSSQSKKKKKIFDENATFSSLTISVIGASSRSRSGT